MAIFAAQKDNVSWPSMSADRYAALERATGIKVIQVGGIWWQQVRPFLFRPMLPYKKFSSGMVPSLSAIGAFQYGVQDGQSFNSYLNPIVFDAPNDYEVKNLRYSVQKHIKKALKNNVSVTRIVDEREFFERAYPCYLSFYERTKYQFDSSRRHRDGFSRWSHDLFQLPETIILGAFSNDELVSFEIACVVEDTLILKTLVNSDKALKLGAPDLLLHTYRTSASQDPNIRMIYDSMLGQNPGINEYYLVRGARVLALPAYLPIHPALLWLIKTANRNIHKRLLGLNNEELEALHSPSRASGQEQPSA